MKIIEPNTDMIKPNEEIDKILKRQEMIIKAISISKAWHALYLTKQGTFGFLTKPANKIKKNNNPPRGRDSSIIATGKIINFNTFR